MPQAAHRKAPRDWHSINMNRVMTEISAEQNSANARGILWMIVAMGAFALEDALVKTIVAHLPVAEVLILMGLGGTLLFAVAARARRERIFSPDVISRPMRIRACFEVTARLFYMLALALTPLSATTVILQATPIVVVLGAAFLFGEKVGWRRWAAILVGLAGVLIVLRPGAESFSLLSVLGVIGMLGFAGRDLASRAAPRSLSTSVLGLYGFVAVVLAGILYGLLWERSAFVVPTLSTAALLSVGILTGVLAYGALMKAMRTGAVSVVTPFRYTRMLFGISLGVFVFGEQLDLPMIVGSLIIVLAGIAIPKLSAAPRLRGADKRPA